MTTVPPIPDPEPSQWEEPTPVGAKIDLAPFPVEVFPAWLADHVRATAEFTQTDPAMAATCALGVLSACAGGRLEVEVRPGWREPTNVFLATIAPPGERKTPVQVTMTAPLREAERVLATDAAPKIREAETLRAIAVAKAEQARREAARNKGDLAEAEADAIDAANMAEAITVPTLPRLLCDDVTPEKLAVLLAENGGRIALISDEGGIFDTLAGRYSNLPNLDAFLKGHAGSPLRVDRTTRESSFVDKPALTVALMVQPVVLRTVGGNELFRGRGLLARFFFVVPTSMVGRRNVNPEPVPGNIAQHYALQVATIARVLAEWEDPAVVTLSTDARETLFKAMQAIEDQLGPGGPLDHIADWTTKLAGGIVRMAALLHLAHHPKDAWRTEIPAETMAGAVSLGAVLTAHYRAATEAMGLDKTTEDARYLIDLIRRTGRPEFTVRDVHMKVTRSRFPKVGDLAVPLELLEDHGWIRLKPAAEHTGPGRKPSPRYELNPYTEST